MLLMKTFVDEILYQLAFAVLGLICLAHAGPCPLGEVGVSGFLMAETLWYVLQTAIVVHQIIAVATVTEELDALQIVRITVFVRD